MLYCVGINHGEKDDLRRAVYRLVVTMLVKDKRYILLSLPAYFTNKATIQKGPRDKDYLIKNKYIIVATQVLNGIDHWRRYFHKRKQAFWILTAAFNVTRAQKKILG